MSSGSEPHGIGTDQRRRAREGEYPTQSVRSDSNHLQHRPEQQPKVEPDARVSDVMEVVGHLAADAPQVRVRWELELRQAGDTGLDQKAAGISGDQVIEPQRRGDLRPLGPGTDETHLA